MLKEIGKGTFGKAFKAHSKLSSSQVVIKKIETSQMTTRQRQEAVNEVNVLKKLRHPYIVKHFDNFIDGGCICIVMQYANSGDLHSRIKTMRNSALSFPEDQISRWFSQILLGISYMHSKNIMHRDLKPQNIFLSSHGDKVLIGDFGVCKEMKSKFELAKTITGTPYYLSPEIFQHKPYSMKSDIWSIGCILYEMAAFKVPFDAVDVQSLGLKVTRGSNPSFPPKYSKDLRDIFLDTLQRDHRTRPSADELLTRAYIKTLVESLVHELEDEDKENTVSTIGSTTRTESPSKKLTVSSPTARPPLYTPRPVARDTRVVSPLNKITSIRSPSPNLLTAKVRNPSPPYSFASRLIRSPSPAPLHRPVASPARPPAKLIRSPSPAGSTPIPGRSPSPLPATRIQLPFPQTSKKVIPSARIYPPSPVKQRIQTPPVSMLRLRKK